MDNPNIIDEKKMCAMCGKIEPKSHMKGVRILAATDGVLVINRVGYICALCYWKTLDEEQV